MVGGGNFCSISLVQYASYYPVVYFKLHLKISVAIEMLLVEFFVEGAILRRGKTILINRKKMGGLRVRNFIHRNLAFVFIIYLFVHIFIGLGGVNLLGSLFPLELMFMDI